MSEPAVVMLACYEVEPADRAGFLELLKETEAIYRAESVVTDRPILRMESIEDSGYLVELIEWRSMAVLGEVQENERIQAKWSEIKSRWRRGDFPINEVPETKAPWAVMRSIA